MAFSQILWLPSRTIQQYSPTRARNMSLHASRLDSGVPGQVREAEQEVCAKRRSINRIDLVTVKSEAWKLE